MSDFFDKVIENELEIAFANFKEANAKLTGFYAHKQMLWSSGHRIQIQQEVCAVVEAYGARMYESLTRHEAEHSPIKLSDFDDAKTSITSLAVRLANYIKEKQEASQKSFGNTFKMLPDGESVTRAIRKGKLTIDGGEKVFRSKRSFWKWAWGTTIRRIYTTALVAVGASLPTIVRSLWAHFS